MSSNKLSLCFFKLSPHELTLPGKESASNRTESRRNEGLRTQGGEETLSIGKAFHLALSPHYDRVRMKGVAARFFYHRPTAPSRPPFSSLSHAREITTHPILLHSRILGWGGEGGKVQ